MNCGRPTRSCARRRRTLPRRSSTAGSGHDRDQSTIIVRSTGSSRSAGCCRSPHRRSTPMSRDGPILQGCRPEPGGTRRGWPRSGACTRPTSATTACARSGGSSPARGSRSPAARWRGSCGRWACTASSANAGSAPPFPTQPPPARSTGSTGSSRPSACSSFRCSGSDPGREQGTTLHVRGLRAVSLRHAHVTDQQPHNPTGSDRPCH